MKPPGTRTNENVLYTTYASYLQRQKDVPSLSTNEDKEQMKAILQHAAGWKGSNYYLSY